MVEGEGEGERGEERGLGGIFAVVVVDSAFPLALRVLHVLPWLLLTFAEEEEADREEEKGLCSFLPVSFPTTATFSFTIAAAAAAAAPRGEGARVGSTGNDFCFCFFPPSCPSSFSSFTDTDMRATRVVVTAREVEALSFSFFTSFSFSFFTFFPFSSFSISFSS